MVIGNSAIPFSSVKPAPNLGRSARYRSHIARKHRHSAARAASSSHWTWGIRMPKQHQLYPTSLCHIMWMVDDGWINWVGKLNITQISQEPGSECLEAGWETMGDQGRPLCQMDPNGLCSTSNSSTHLLLEPVLDTSSGAGCCRELTSHTRTIICSWWFYRNLQDFALPC